MMLLAMICPAGLLCPEGQAVVPDPSANACPRGYYCPQGDTVSESALVLGIHCSLIKSAVQLQSALGLVLLWEPFLIIFFLLISVLFWCSQILAVFALHKTVRNTGIMFSEMVYSIQRIGSAFYYTILSAFTPDS